MDLPTLSDKIRNEITITQELENLNVQTSNLVKSFINSFLKKSSKEFKQWESIGKTISEIPLTEEGKVRLAIKHELMEERVTPQHSVLLITILPIAIYWLLKNGISYVVGSHIEKYQKDQARLKRRLGQSKAKQERKASKIKIR